MARVVGRILLSGLFFLMGCSQPPQIPQLPHPNSETTPNIILRDSLTSQDVKTLFKAINQKGQWNRLSHLLVKAPDQDLEVLGKTANTYLYQEALHTEGFLSLLENRVQEKSFSQALRSLKTLSSDSSALSSLTHLIKDSLSHPLFPKLVQRNSWAFSDAWTRAVEKIKLPFQFLSHSQEKNSQWVKDLTLALNDSDLESALIPFLGSIRKSELGRSFFLSLLQLKENRGESAFIDLAQGIKEAIQSKEDKPSSLDRLLKLVQILNQPSNGLFSKAQETLKTDEGQTIVRLLAERFEPMVLRGTAGFIFETLKEPLDDEILGKTFWSQLPRKSVNDAPSDKLVQLMRRVQFALDKTTSTSRPQKDPKTLLNAYLLTVWLEQLARENKEQIESISADSFNELFWTYPLKPFSFTLNLIELDPSGKPIKDSDKKWVLASKIEADLKFLGLEDFSQDLKYMVKQESFGSTITQFISQTETANFKENLLQAVSILHLNHPFSDPIPTLTSIAYFFSRSDSGAPLTLTDFETQNLLVSIENLFRGLPYVKVRKLLKFAFEDLQIGNMSEEDRERLKSLYPKNPECAELLDNILKNLQVIYDWDQVQPGKLSLLEAFHTLLTQSRNRDLSSLNSFLTFLQKSELLKVSSNQAKFPSVIQMLSQSEEVGQLLNSLTLLTTEQQESLSVGLQSFLGKDKSEFQELKKWGKDVLLQNSDALPLVLTWVQQNNLLLQLTPSERLWFKRFVESQEFLQVYQAFSHVLSDQPMNEVLNELETLQTQGELENIFKVLGNLQSERMQRLALVFWNWEKSQELKSFILLIKSLTKS